MIKILNNRKKKRNSFFEIKHQIKIKKVFKFFSEQSEQALLISFYVSVPEKTFVSFDFFAVKIFRSHATAAKNHSRGNARFILR